MVTRKKRCEKRQHILLFTFRLVMWARWNSPLPLWAIRVILQLASYFGSTPNFSLVAALRQLKRLGIHAD
jgi:hypothetical protein